VTTIEVFADVACPFTHVGLRRLVERRAALGRQDVGLVVRAWPLEVVNGEPLDPALIDEEVADIRGQAAPDLFTGFRVDRFPASSLPALALTAAAYREGPAAGEQVALRLRELLFEEGTDVADPEVLREVARAHGVGGPIDDVAPVLADHAEGVRRGVVGSPHFFAGDGSYFCPSLDVGRDEHGELRVAVDGPAFERFVAACFG
jgi:predicted DsbA family dithiol-disulfide isomerase